MGACFFGGVFLSDSRKFKKLSETPEDESITSVRPAQDIAFPIITLNYLCIV